MPHHTDVVQETIQELQAMIQHLDDYLLGDRLYKTITVSSPRGDNLIKMTLGGMLERIDLLEEMPDESEAARVAREAKEALARAQRTLPQQFFAMLGRETKSYTDSWNWFLQNCWEGNARCRDDYAQEVDLRLRLARLLDYGGDHVELANSRQRLNTLDQQLREIWEPADTPIKGEADDYPRDSYWWLYGLPQPSNDGDF